MPSRSVAAREWGAEDRGTFRRQRVLASEGPPDPSLRDGEVTTTKNGRRLAVAASDEQLRLLVSYVARMCLEVERGLRSPDHLRALRPSMDDHEWRKAGQIGRFRGGPVTAKDIGPPMLSRLGAADVVATVTTRTEGARWGALTLRLRAVGQHWHLVNVQRLLAAKHYRQRQRRSDPSPVVPVDEQIRRVAQERTLANAALRATAWRLSELDRGDPQHPHLRGMLDHWRRTVGDLGAHLDSLRAGRKAGDVQRAITRT